MKLRSSHRTSTVVALGVLVLVQLMGAASADAALRSRIASAVRHSGVSGSTSVVVYDAQTRSVIYGHNQRRAVAPASNQKLFTAAGALRALGPNYRLQTRLALRGTQHNHTFDGSIYLIGGGDPSLSTRKFARKNLDGTGSNIALLINPLQFRGIRRITGKLVVDESYLDRQRYVSSWPSSFRFDETTALGALTVNQSYLGSCLCGASSHKPAVRAGQVYLNLLESSGVRVDGGIRVGRTPDNAQIVGTVQSPPMRMLVRFMNKHSDNFTAEILLKDLGKVQTGSGSTKRGAREARRQARLLGVPVRNLRIKDGSGLSSSNRASARQVAELLNRVDNDATIGWSFVQSLAVSGRSGTLKHRLVRHPYRGRVRGKTGTLRRTSALSGYAQRYRGGRRYGFSVITASDGGQVPIGTAHQLQDRLAAILVR